MREDFASTVEIFTVVLLAVILVGCGDDSTTPMTAPSPTTAITVTLPTILVVGVNQQASAIATLANGATQALSAGFRSDNASVATVTDTGLVTPVANGRVNIYVVSGGQQGTANTRVVPNYQGTWRGSYVTGCVSTGWWQYPGPDSCAGLDHRVLPTTMSLTQNGASISGTFQLGRVAFSPISSPIEEDGSTAFTGTAMISSAISIETQWQINSPQQRRITGGHTQIWRGNDVSGEMRIYSGIVDWLTLVSGGTVIAGAGATVTAGAPLPTVLTKRDLLGLLK